MNIARLLDAIIPIACGTYVTLAAFGVIRLSKNPQKTAAWRSKYGALVKVLGPVIILWVLFILAVPLGPQQ